MAPEPPSARRSRAAKHIVPTLVAVALALASPARALRVATWNLLQYPQTNLAARQPLFRQVMAQLDPDVMIVQELDAPSGLDSMLTNVLDVVEPGQWTGTWVVLGGEGGAVLWKPAKVAITNIGALATGGPRPVMFALVKPLGYAHNGAWFRLYSVHFKAGNPTFTPADSTTRRNECTSFRTSLNNTVTTVVGTNFLVGGDTNFYGDWEGGYQRLVESQAINCGRCFDPLTLPGTWNSNGAYAVYDTQCPCLTNCGPGQAGGGLDDRFDLFLTSSSLRDGSGLELIPSSYTPFGNDGQHFNDDINGGGFNLAVGLDLANALHDVSDHLPVIVTLQLPARIAADSQLDFGDALVGALLARTLHVSNGAVAPADSLRYSLAAPAGFAAPTGPFVLAAAAGQGHDVTLATGAPGVRTGTLTVITNDVDTSAKAVLLSGRVLAHAVASLDSLAPVASAMLAFGAHGSGGFQDQPVRVFDQGWHALQAGLQVQSAAIAGGGGRFSLVSGSAPRTLRDVGATWSVRFDDAGATADSTYEATLSFTTADEPLPGALAASPLSVSLTARVTSGVGAVGGDALALRFLPPRPNPAHGAAELGFELPAAAPVDLAIFDTGGRRIATLVSGNVGAGRHSLRWNTQDDAGHTVGAGLYFVRFATPGLTRATRLAVLP